MDKCRQDKCCLAKCHCDSWNLLQMVQGKKKEKEREEYEEDERLWLALSKEEKILAMQEEEKMKDINKDNPEEKKNKRLEEARKEKEMWEDWCEVEEQEPDHKIAEIPEIPGILAGEKETGENLEEEIQENQETPGIPEDLVRETETCEVLDEEEERFLDVFKEDEDEQEPDLGQSEKLCLNCLLMPCQCMLVKLEMKIKMLKVVISGSKQEDEAVLAEGVEEKEAKEEDPKEKENAKSRDFRK